MKIIIPTFEDIKLMPPTINLFKILAELGYEVIYITIFPDEYYPNFQSKRIINLPLYKKNYSIRDNLGFPQIKGLRGLVFRLDKLLKKFLARKLEKVLINITKSDALLWIVNEMTPLLAGSKFIRNFKNKYIFTIYELHNAKFSTRHIKRVAQFAKSVVVPEYNRAHIQKYFFGLKKLPYILPNKPEEITPFCPLDEDATKILVKMNSLKAKGKKIIIYMGIIGKERPLENLIELINKNNEFFEFVILGRPGQYLEELKYKYPNGFTYLGWVKPPLHLKIAKLADIGVVIYEPQPEIGLNALFCAPNKIYEYTGLGLPVIANDIPGLHNAINSYNCGVFIDFEASNKSENNLFKLIENFEFYKNGALNFYNSIDVKILIKEIIQKTLNS